MPQLLHFSARKKDKIYAAVIDGDGAQRSMTWRFLALGPDLYAGGPGMGNQKLSFHGSGVCHWKNMRRPNGQPDETFIRWKRRPADDELRQVFSIEFPGIRPTPARKIDRPGPLLLKMPLAEPGFATQLAIYHTTRAPDEVHFDPGRVGPYNAIRLTSGEWFYLAPQIVEFDETKVNLPKALPVDPGVKPGSPVYMHLFGMLTPEIGGALELGGLELNGRDIAPRAVA